jgi:hypothetical protein
VRGQVNEKIEAKRDAVRGVPTTRHVTVRIRSRYRSIDKEVSAKALNGPLEPRQSEILTLTRGNTPFDGYIRIVWKLSREHSAILAISKLLLDQ